MELPKKYNPKETEEKWEKFWEENKTYKFNPNTEKKIFSIDTPPPTVSGKMHIGHARSYSQQDFIARYRRMKGYELFFPFGTDDNGLPTERLIEKTKGVKATKMDRQDFIDLCLKTLKEELRPEYLADWKRIGFSSDFDVFYSTINEKSREISQKAFLDLVKKDRVYKKASPVIWDPVMETALAQVEIEDKEVKSTFNEISFKTKEGDTIKIATTRPELLCACVAVFVHPKDDRYKDLVGDELTVPYYHFKVPVLSDERADPEKGTGIVMCCTFGDQTDIEWYKAYDLPLKEAITKDGRMTSIAGDLEGLRIKEARSKIIEKMKESGELLGQKDITHTVNVGERSGEEIEFLNSEQWFIRYLDIKDELLRRGDELNWHPEHMKSRYSNWIHGLQWDWCISRQRFFGIPFPVWYDKKTGEPIYAKENQLPVDPLKDLPEGYTREQVIPDNDVMDTWATSSLSPHLAADLFEDHPIYDKIYPMSLRPQAHEIITFWLFNTVVRSHIHENVLPWKDVIIFGWALDPNGKKMSKSKGNTIAPQQKIAEYSADALRYWASISKLGEDGPTQEKDFQNGHKLVNKIFNASKFVLMHLEDFDGTRPERLEAFDEWILAKLNRTIKKATDAFESYEFSRARRETDHLFWQTCDDYLEIAKDRLYNPENRGKQARRSAQYTLHEVLKALLKMYAPILPFITEEVYSWKFAEEDNIKSIHNSAWPSIGEYREDIIDAGEEAISVIHEARRFKANHEMSMKKELSRIKIATGCDLTGFIDDIKSTTKATDIEISEAEETSIEIQR
ncbi:MAG: valine--tRNA ligase [Candidatus Woesearchaeota archaeon]